MTFVKQPWITAAVVVGAALIAGLALSAEAVPMAAPSATVAAASAPTPAAAVPPAPVPAASMPAAPVPTATAPATAVPAVPVGKPVEGASKPEPVGASTCLACHAAREDFRGTIHAKAWPKMKGIEFEQSCETCHGNGSLHAAAAGDRADPGFSTIHAPAKMGAKASSGLCMTCHAGKARLHWDGSVHETRGVGCLECHAVHGGHPKNLRTEDPKDVCLRCHQNVKAEIRRQSHHPIIEGKVTCTDCHNPHGTAGPKLLVGNSVTETCFKCHADKRGPFLWEHRPVSEDCTICHVPHGSVHDRLLRQKPPYLCQSCHSGNRHPGTIYAVNPTTPGDNSYEQLKVQVEYRGCLNCHANIHGSNHPAGNRFLR